MTNKYNIDNEKYKLYEKFFFNLQQNNYLHNELNVLRHIQTLKGSFCLDDIKQRIGIMDEEARELLGIYLQSNVIEKVPGTTCPIRLRFSPYFMKYKGWRFENNE